MAGRITSRARVRAVLTILLVVAFGALTAPPSTAQASAGGRAPYYLSLGDSLAQGVQPDTSGVSVETSSGYVDDLYATEQAQIPRLRLAKLGCPGESTGSMIFGGICSYPARTQLAQAVLFLHTHDVAFITIDIGANNVDGCVSSSGIDTTCLNDGITAAQLQLPVILAALRWAAPQVPIFAMNYYDPFAASWLSGLSGQMLARASVCLTTGSGYPIYCPFPTGYNGILDGIYAAFGVPVADVAATFQTNDFTPVASPPSPLPANTPTNVVIICGWTWMCAPSPVGPNIHANATGYQEIADTFAATIGTL